MIFVVMNTVDDVGMVSVNTKKIAEYAEKQGIFDIGGRIEAWNKEKRVGSFQTLKQFMRAIRPGSDDDDNGNGSYGGFW